MIASGHPIMRDGLRLRIQQEPDMYVVCEASDLAQILRDFNVCRPDVVLLDLQLPRGACLHAMKSIRNISPRTPLVVLADFPDEEDGPPGSGQGTTVMVSKISAHEEVIPAIRKASAAARGSDRADRI